METTLHKYINKSKKSGVHGLIAESETEYCCKKLKLAVDEKHFRISFGGMSIKNAYPESLWLKSCPFCGSKIAIKIHRISNPVRIDNITTQELNYKLS